MSETKLIQIIEKVAFGAILLNIALTFLSFLGLPISPFVDRNTWVLPAILISIAPLFVYGMMPKPSWVMCIFWCFFVFTMVHEWSLALAVYLNYGFHLKYFLNPNMLENFVGIFVVGFVTLRYYSWKLFWFAIVNISIYLIWMYLGLVVPWAHFADSSMVTTYPFLRVVENLTYVMSLIAFFLLKPFSVKPHENSRTTE